MSEKPQSGTRSSKDKSRKDKRLFALYVTGVLLIPLLLLPRISGTLAADSIQLELAGTVTLGGDRNTRDIDAGEFQFFVVSETGGVSIDENIRPVDAGGRISLGSFTFSQEGTYVFQVRQRDMAETGMKYDRNLMRVIVTIYRNQEEKLSYDVTYVKNGSQQAGIHFHNSYTAPQPGHLTAESDAKVSKIDDEEEVVHSFHYTNTGEQTLYGLWLREYIPDDCRYMEHSGAGAYGVIEGKEHVTAFTTALEPGESMEFTVTYRLNACRPDHYTIQPELLCEITGSREYIPTNFPEDPAERIPYPELTR